MIRFILIRKVRDRNSGAEYANNRTIDADVPALESALKSGGIGEEGYDLTELVGLELIEQPAQES